MSTINTSKLSHNEQESQTKSEKKLNEHLKKVKQIKEKSNQLIPCLSAFPWPRSPPLLHMLLSLLPPAAVVCHLRRPQPAAQQRFLVPPPPLSCPRSCRSRRCFDLFPTMQPCFGLGTAALCRRQPPQTTATFPIQPPPQPPPTSSTLPINHC